MWLWLRLPLHVHFLTLGMMHILKWHPHTVLEVIYIPVRGISMLSPSIIKRSGWVYWCCGANHRVALTAHSAAGMPTFVPVTLSSVCVLHQSQVTRRAGHNSF